MRAADGTLIVGVMVIGLLATITNFVPLSVCFVVVTPIIPYLLLRNRSVPRPVFALLLLFGYFFASTLLYAPASFADPAFYRRDGNVFITFLPLLIGGLLTLRVDVEGIVQRFLQWATATNVLMMAVFFVTGGSILVHEPGVYHFLFEAHNAAGGFLSMICALALGAYYNGRRRLFWLVLVVVNVVGLVLTVSRGSALALLLAVVFVRFLKERFIRAWIVVGLIATAGMFAYTYPLWAEMGKPAGILVADNVGLDTLGTVPADANVLDRVLFLWPRALDLFLESPIVGTGFGSYNDIPYRIEGISHVVAFNNPTELTSSSSHAHNTYLHVLAETGIIGFALLLYFLQQTWRAISALESPSLRLGLRLALWVAVFSSLTEHRLFTPAQMLPFAIILGLTLARARWDRRYGPIEDRRTGAPAVPGGIRSGLQPS